MSENVTKWDKEIGLAVSKFHNRMPNSREDMIQECYVALLKAGDKIKNAEYAYVVCFNCLQNYVRDNAEDDEILDESREPGEVTDETALMCEQLLHKLPPSEEYVIRYLFGIGVPQVPLEQLANVLSMSKGNLSKEKTRILKKLKRVYARTARKN